MALVEELIDKLLEILFYLIEVMINSVSTVFGWLGLEFSGEAELILTYMVAILVLAALMSYVVKIFGRYIFNSITGVALLLLLHYVLEISIPMTPFVIIVTVLFGVPGVLAVLILYFGGALPPGM